MSSYNELQQGLFRSMRSCCFDFIQVIANSENHLGRYIFGHLNPNSHVKSVAFNFLTVTILCLITGNELFNFDSNNLFLELVSIIINFIFLSSLLLLYRVSHASSRRVDKPCRWHVALNIAAVKDYGIPLSPFLSYRLLRSNQC